MQPGYRITSYWFYPGLSNIVSVQNKNFSLTFFYDMYVRRDNTKSVDNKSTFPILSGLHLLLSKCRNT